MNWIKISLINFVIFFLLIIVIEVGLRFIWTGYQCYKSDCNFSRITNLSIYDVLNEFLDINLGFTKYDKDLGYIPNPGFEKTINAKGWKNKYVSVDKYSFRKNNSDNIPRHLDQNHTILAVGDSFTFGDQVSNHETWPACLERELGKTVLNAGVPGYGAAQAVKRASMIDKDFDINRVILSIYLNDDFHRDQKVYLRGFPRPSVITANGQIKYDKVPDLGDIGTKFNPKDQRVFLAFIKNNSMLGSRIIDALNIDLSGKSKFKIHPKSAQINEIINFTISEFEELSIKNKLIVFQYAKHDLYDENYAVQKTQHIREQVSSILNEKKIDFVDTYNVLFLNDKKGLKKVWYSHHSPFGNEIVCSQLLKFLAQD